MAIFNSYVSHYQRVTDVSVKTLLEATYATTNAQLG